MNNSHIAISNIADMKNQYETNAYSNHFIRSNSIVLGQHVTYVEK